jgi:hypothetical protein
VTTSSQAFLGLTLGCARCHNHKLEALSMHDYYRMVAVFRPLQRPRKGKTELDGPALPPGREKEFPNAPRGYFLVEAAPKSPPTHILLRGQATRPGPEVQPGVPAVLVEKQPEFLTPSTHTTRRRLTLARWIASPDHPLTARVIVNRVWMWHFGEGLVRTPSDFGIKGDPPTHPELLDWLAHQFVKDGWSLKKLHRLIVTSNAWRMSKRSRPDCAAADPDNRLLWRMPYRRLEGEAIRDSMLAVSGQLNPQTGGPSVFVPVPKEALEGHSDPGKVWGVSPERDASRRTIYVHVKRSLPVPLLEVLDVCDAARSTARRNVTTVAPQALTLYNGEFVNKQARHFAERLEKEAGTNPGQQIELAYRLALSRPPTAREQKALLAFLEKEGAEKGGAKAAREQMCRVIFNLNEFVYPD